MSLVHFIIRLIAIMSTVCWLWHYSNWFFQFQKSNMHRHMSLYKLNISHPLWIQCNLTLSWVPFTSRILDAYLDGTWLAKMHSPLLNGVKSVLMEHFNAAFDELFSKLFSSILPKSKNRKNSLWNHRKIRITMHL